MLPDVVNLMLTGKCNNNCIYCYAKIEGPDLDTKALKKMISIIKNNGSKGIVLCGGEPTLRPDFKIIINELKKQKLKIFLDTDGDFFFENKEVITENVSVLSFPIDFPNQSYRNGDNLNNILNALSFYKKCKKRPMLCIGTVVTQDNYNILEDIGKLIQQYPIDMWILYQFTPSGGNAKLNRLQLEISDTTYTKATSKLEKTFSNKFKVIISPTTERSHAYFLIKPNGQVFTPTKQKSNFKEISLGHIFDTDIVEKWDQTQNIIKYNKKAKHFNQQNILPNKNKVTHKD